MIGTPTTRDTSALAWFKSSYSSSGDGNGIEVAAALGVVHVRDSKTLGRAAARAHAGRVDGLECRTPPRLNRWGAWMLLLPHMSTGTHVLSPVAGLSGAMLVSSPASATGRAAPRNGSIRSLSARGCLWTVTADS